MSSFYFEIPNGSEFFVCGLNIFYLGVKRKFMILYCLPLMTCLPRSLNISFCKLLYDVYSIKSLFRGYPRVNTDYMYQHHNLQNDRDGNKLIINKGVTQSSQSYFRLANEKVHWCRLLYIWKLQVRSALHRVHPALSLFLLLYPVVLSINKFLFFFSAERPYSIKFEF